MLTLIRDGQRERLHITARVTHPALTMGQILKLGRQIARASGNPVTVDYMTDERGDFVGLKLHSIVDEQNSEIQVTDLLITASETTPVEAPVCAS